MDIRAYGKVLLMYLALVLLQVMVFNNINIGTWGITPLFYVLFVLVLPFETPSWALLVMSFLMGYTIDVFCDTPGLNAGASVAMAYARTMVLKYIQPRDGYENGLRPYLMDMGMQWFLQYSLSLVLVHHIFFFMFDVFGFAHFFKTVSQIVITSVITELFVIVSQYIAFRK